MQTATGEYKGVPIHPKIKKILEQFEYKGGTTSVRVSFAKYCTGAILSAKRTSGGKPVQGHGSVAINEPRKRRIRVEKMFKHVLGQFYGPF
jgi:hypothetical protein